MRCHRFAPLRRTAPATERAAPADARMPRHCRAMASVLKRCRAHEAHARTASGGWARRLPSDGWPKNDCGHSLPVAGARLCGASLRPGRRGARRMGHAPPAASGPANHPGRRTSGGLAAGPPSRRRQAFWAAGRSLRMRRPRNSSIGRASPQPKFNPHRSRPLVSNNEVVDHPKYQLRHLKGTSTTTMTHRVFSGSSCWSGPYMFNGGVRPLTAFHKIRGISSTKHANGANPLFRMLR